MRRTVRLTERDLSRLVRRVIRENIVEEIGQIPLSKINTIGAKGTYYVENGKLIINDGTMSMEVTAG
jgi:hypothetical protein